MRWFAITLVLGACGRFEFDALRDGGTSDDADGADGAVDTPPSVTPITFAQDNFHQVGTGVTNTVSYPTAVMQGDLLVVAVDVNNHTSNLMTLADSLGSTFTIKPEAQVDSPSYRIWIGYAISAGSGANQVTATLSSTATNFEMRVHEYTGASATPFDAVATGAGTMTGPDMVKTSALTTTVPGDLLFAAVNFSGGSGGDGGTGFTVENTYFGDVVEDRIVPTPGTYTPTATANADTQDWGIIAIAFRPR